MAPSRHLLTSWPTVAFGAKQTNVLSFVHWWRRIPLAGHRRQLTRQVPRIAVLLQSVNHVVGDDVALLLAEPLAESPPMANLGLFVGAFVQLEGRLCGRVSGRA
jgi:hypothetical protein